MRGRVTSAGSALVRMSSFESGARSVGSGGDVLEVGHARRKRVAGALEETADHQGLAVAQSGGGGHASRDEARDPIHLVGEVGRAHLRGDRQEDVALVRDARDERDDGAEGFEHDVGGEAGCDTDRDLAAHLEDRVLPTHRHQLRLRQDRGEPLFLEELNDRRDVLIIRQIEGVRGLR